jgi:hypothetical protein
MPHRDGCEDRQLFPGRSAPAKRGGRGPACAVNRLLCPSTRPGRPSAVLPSRGGSPRAGRMALIGKARADRSTLLIAPIGAAHARAGAAARSAALSGRYLCSPPPSGRAAVVGHLHPLARISGRATRRGVAWCETASGRAQCSRYDVCRFVSVAQPDLWPARR